MEEKIKWTEGDVAIFHDGKFMRYYAFGENPLKDVISQSKKDVIEEIKKMKRKEFNLIPGGVQKCSKNHTWFCDCPAYNEAIDDILLSLKDKEDK